MGDLIDYHTHDRFYKALLNYRDTAPKLLREVFPAYLMDQVDLTRVRCEPTSFVDLEQGDLHTDALFTAPWRNGPGEVGLYFVMDHFSKPYPLTAYRMSTYTLRAHARRLEQGLPLIPVIAGVLYHGRQRWTAARDLRELQGAPPEMVQYVLNMRYSLFNLRDTADKDLPEDAFMRATLLLMKHIRRLRDQAFLEDLTGRIFHLIREAESVDFLETMASYMANHTDDMQVVKTTARKVFGAKGEDTVITAARRWMQEGQRELVLRQLTRRLGALPAAKVKAIEDLPLEMLEALADDLLDFKEPNDLTQWLARK